MGCFCDKCSFETFKTNIGEVHELPCGGFFREYEERPKFAHAHRTSPGAYLTDDQRENLARQELADDQRVEASIRKHGLQQSAMAQQAEYLGANCKWQSNGQLANQQQSAMMAQQAALHGQLGGQNLNYGLQNQMQMDAIRSNHAFARGEVFAKDELARADARASRLEAELAESNKTGSLLRARVIELRAELDHRNSFSDLETKTRSELHTRANKLSDECGALKTQNTELLAENARLRRGGK